MSRVPRARCIRGTKRDAETKLAELVHAANRGELVESRKLTLGTWLQTWLETAIKPPHRSPKTYATYKSVITLHFTPALGPVRLQSLQPTHLQHYYQTSSLAQRTLAQHHAILHVALQAALKQGLVSRNVAELVMGTPRPGGDQAGAQIKYWTREEALRFLAVVPSCGPQVTALYHLALDSGARRGELCGLLWQDIDLDRKQVSIMRQLTRAGASPQWGPPKNGQPRTVTLSQQTVELLRAHKAHQAQVKLANRHIYQEYGLVFAKDWWGVRTHGRTLGQPLQVTAIGQAAFKRLIALSGVTRITFHGLRHTCATLLLQNGT